MSVDPASGAFTYIAEDLTIPCRGKVELKVVRYFDSRMAHPWNKSFAGCQFSFDERLRFEYVGDETTNVGLPAWADVMMIPDEVGDDKSPGMLFAVTVLYPNSNQHRFLLQPDGTFAAFLPSVKRILRFNPEDRTYTLGINGFGFHLFREDGKLIAIEDAFGNRLKFDWEFVGDGGTTLPGPQLTAITDPVGRVVRLNYHMFPEQHELEFTRTITDWTGRTWVYDTDADGFIHAYTDPEGHVTRYYVGGDPLKYPYFAPPRGLAIPNLPDVEFPDLSRGFSIDKIEFPNGGYVVNYPSGARPLGRRVGVQIFGDRLAVNHLYDVLGRRTTKLVGVEKPPITMIGYEPWQPLPRNPAGTPAEAHFFEFNSDYNLVRAVDPLGNTYAYEYDDRYRMTASINPRLGVTRFEYDSVGNLVRETDPSGRSRSWEYHPTLPDVTRMVGPGDDAPAYRFEYHPMSGVILRDVDPLESETTYEYSIHGEMTAMVRKRGDRWTYRYSDAGNLLEITNPMGGRTLFEYDALNRMVKSTTPGGRVTRTTYNKLDLVTSVVGPDGGTWSFEYDGNRNVIKATNPLGNSVCYEFDALNQLTRVTDPLGSQTSLGYDEFGNLAQTVDALGRKSSFEYDRLRRLVKAVDAAGSSTRLERAKFCGETKVIDPLGRETVSYTDMLCRVTEVELPDGGRLRTVFNDEGEVESVTDPLGRATRFTYDKLGRVLEVRDALNQVETRTWDPHGNLTSVTDRRGHTARFEYDALDRLQKLTRRDGSTVYFGYDGDGKLLAVRDGRENTWRFRYDSAGRLSASVDPMGHDLVRHVYDSAGRLVEQLSALGAKVTREYDAADRVVAVTDPLENRSTLSYDPMGNVRTLADPLGRMVHLQYDALDRLVSVVDPMGGEVRRVLDAVGNLTSILDQNGNPTYYELDVMNRVKAEIYADGTRLEWDYDQAGNVVTQRDPRGFTTAFEYDPLARLTRVAYDDEPDAVFSYDANSNVVERHDGTGAYTFAYDKEDRVVAFTQPNGPTYQTEHDAEGNRIALVSPDGRRQATAYDTAGRLSDLTTPDGKRTTFRYDVEGRRIRVDRPNGTYTAYEYDLASRIKRLTHRTEAGAKITPDFRLTHDPMGNVLTVKDEESPLWTYGYDRLDRLVSAVSHENDLTWEWAYDAAGNRLVETLNGATTRSRYNNLNQLVQMGETEFWYDRAGNLARKAAPGAVTGYRFDSRDRLVEVQTPQNRRLQYAYDSSGRMLTRKLSTDTNPSTFEWDGWDLLREVDPDGVGTVYDAPHGEIVNFKRGTGVRQVHADALGSVRSITDSTGATVADFDFDAWGNVIVSSGPLTGGIAMRFIGALGPRLDAESDLIYMRHRWYDSATGRFLSRDPVSNTEPYVYGNNLPTSRIDPYGLWSITPIDVGIGIGLGLLGFAGGAIVGMAIAATAPAWLAAGLGLGAAAIGGWGTGQLLYEVIWGRAWDWSGSGRPLTDSERTICLGEAIVAVPATLAPLHPWSRRGAERDAAWRRLRPMDRIRDDQGNITVGDDIFGLNSDLPPHLRPINLTNASPRNLRKTWGSGATPLMRYDMPYWGAGSGSMGRVNAKVIGGFATYAPDPNAHLTDQPVILLVPNPSPSPRRR